MGNGAGGKPVQPAYGLLETPQSLVSRATQIPPGLLQSRSWLISHDQGACQTENDILQKCLLKLFAAPPGLTGRTGLVPKGRTCKKNMYIIFYDYADALATMTDGFSKVARCGREGTCRFLHCVSPYRLKSAPRLVNSAPRSLKTQHAGVGWRASGADPKHRCRCHFSSCVCSAHGFAEIPARYCRFSR